MKSNHLTFINQISKDDFQKHFFTVFSIALISITAYSQTDTHPGT